MKKALSLALTLVMCLGLTVPVSASYSAAPANSMVGNDKNTVTINAKDTSGLDLGEKSFRVQNWGYNEETRVSTKAVVETFTPGRVFLLPAGAELVIENEDGYISDAGMACQAWSDPDGDGIFDSRIAKTVITYEDEGMSVGSKVLPTDTTGPLNGKASDSEDIEYGYIWNMSCEGSIYYYTVGYGGGLEGEPAKISADYLIGEFGTNTLFRLAFSVGHDPENYKPIYVDYYFLLTDEHSPESTEPNASAPDYQVSNWAKDRVALAVETGLAADSLGNDYRVNITRAQFAATAVKLYEAMSGEKVVATGESSFTDTTDPVILQAADMGFVSGVGDGKFSPDALVTREQAAVMLSSVYTKLGGEIPAVEATTFADDGDVAGWARNAVAFMNSKEIVTGVGDNNFSPKGNASIEQALLISLKMYETLK